MIRSIALFFFLFSLRFLFSQNACETASYLCAPGTTFNAETSGAPATGAQSWGCLGSEPNPSWFHLNVSSGGSIQIIIAANDDVDFICWGPFPLSSPCGNLNANTQVPNSPNTLSSPANTIQGCSWSGSSTETLIIPNAQAGDHYILLVTNYSQLTQIVSLALEPGGAGLSCARLLTSASSTLICEKDTVNITGIPYGTNLSAVSYSLNPGGYIYPSPSFIVTPSVTTTYTMYCTGINQQNAAQALFSTVQVSVIPRPQFMINAYPSSVICSPQNINLIASGVSNCTLVGIDVSLNSYFTVYPQTTTTYTILCGGTNGCMGSETITISVYDCTALSSLSPGSPLSIYPNPNDGHFTIEGTLTGQISITNALGEIIFETGKPAGNFYLDLHDKPNGIYNVRILRDNIPNVFKLVKQ